VISTRVLIELRSVATRQLELALPDLEITRVLAAICCFEVVVKDINLVLNAMIAEAVLGSRWNGLLSGEFSHGRVIGALPGPAFAGDAAASGLLQLKRRLGRLSVQRQTSLLNLRRRHLAAIGIPRDGEPLLIDLPAVFTRKASQRLAPNPGV
jgi:hypothetical protein